jgi:hypothetical protein
VLPRRNAVQDLAAAVAEIADGDLAHEAIVSRVRQGYADFFGGTLWYRSLARWRESSKPWKW